METDIYRQTARKVERGTKGESEGERDRARDIQTDSDGDGK